MATADINSLFHAISQIPAPFPRGSRRRRHSGPVSRAPLLLLAALALCICTSSRCIAASWYKGVIHCHSKFSDNILGYNLDSLRKDATGEDDFVIVTDHTDCYGQDHSAPTLMRMYYEGDSPDAALYESLLPPHSARDVVHHHKPEWTIDDMASRCTWLSGQPGPLMIPGQEVSLSSITQLRHVLVLGLYDKRPGRDTIWYVPSSKITAPGTSQRSVLEMVEKRREQTRTSPYCLVTVAAHPHTWTQHGGAPFDPEDARGLTAIEFCNSRLSGNEDSTDLGYYLASLRAYARDHGRPLLSVTAGNDNHASDMGSRKTYILAEGVTPENILHAIALGATYATRKSMWLKSINFAPGLDPDADLVGGTSFASRRVRPSQHVPQVKLDFEIGFPGLLRDAERVVIFRDGNESPVFSRTYLPGRSSMSISWQDSDTSPGIHTYVVAVRDERAGESGDFIQLITSPIVFYVGSLDGDSGVRITEWKESKTPGIPPIGGLPAPSEVAAKGPIDLVFCIDCTGSMTDDIDRVKRDARDLIERLRRKCSSLRIGLVTYRDFSVDGSRHLETNLTLTEDVDSIVSAIKGITTTGGGDPSEDVLDGLKAAIDMPWRGGVAKFIVLMGDAPAKDPDHEGKTKEDIAAAARAVDPAHIYSLALHSGAMPSFEELSRLTDGQAFEVKDVERLPQAIEDTVSAAIVHHSAEVGGVVAFSPGLDWQLPLLISALVGAFVLGVLCVAIATRRRMSLAPLPSTPLAWLQVYEPNMPPRNVPVLSPTVRLGRDPRNAVVLSDPTVSGTHAELTVYAEQAVITDLNSTHGTNVNGQRVTRQTVMPRDRIELGGTVLVFFPHQSNWGG